MLYKEGTKAISVLDKISYNEKEGDLYSFSYISDNLTLLKLMDSIVNFNHSVGIVVKLVFNSNYNKAFLLLVELLNIILSYSNK